MENNLVLYPLDGTRFPVDGQGLDDGEIAEFLLALTGRTGFALGDLPPRQGLTWLIRWSGRSWPSSCGGFSTDYLVGRGNLLFQYNYSQVDFNKLGVRPEPGVQMAKAYSRKWEYDLGEILQPYLPGEFSAGSSNKFTVFLPFTNMTAEYINLLFIYAGRGYPFRFVDSFRAKQVFPVLGPELIPEATPFSLYEMEMRVLSLLVVEQAFALTNLKVLAAERGIAHTSFHITGPTGSSGVVNNLFFGPGGLLRPEDGKSLQLYTVPFYPNMSEAIDAFLENKWSARKDEDTPYLQPEPIHSEIPPPSKTKIKRVKDFCEEIYQRYGRFPIYYPPLYSQIVTLASRSTSN